MQIKQLATVFSAATLLASVHTSALSETYQFQILANPDALEATADPSLDVLHTITIDSSKIPSFTSATLIEANTALTFLLGLGLMAGVTRRKFKR